MVSVGSSTTVTPRNAEYKSNHLYLGQHCCLPECRDDVPFMELNTCCIGPGDGDLVPL